MDHLMSLRNTFPPDTTAEFHSSGVDFFSSQGSSFPATSYGQQSSVNPQGANQPAYSLSADLQHGHSIAQNYQPNMSEGQMASAFMSQNQPQPNMSEGQMASAFMSQNQPQPNMSEGQMASAFMSHNQPQPLSDHYYSFQTPALYQQKHQAATNQLTQNPPSPCHNQTYSVSMHQNQNSQFVSLPGHPQSPQMSPRHFAQHQTPQIMVYHQKSQQIPSSPNQQHQASVLISGSAQSQRLNQSPKQIVSKQQNNPKDRTCDAQFYSNQVLQRSDSSMNNMHKSQSGINKFGHTAQSAQFFHNGGMNSENKINGDSQLRNIQGSHYGNSMKVQTSNLSKPNVYVSQSSFEHINASIPSNLQQSRYESILNNSQRMQKASSGKAAVSYMPEVTKNRKYGANFILPDYNSNCPSNSKTPPNKPSPDPSSGAFAYVQNMHYKPRNTHETLLDNREREKVISRNASARSARPVPGGSETLESHSNDFLYSNSYALPSIAALVNSTKEISRQNKVNDNMRSNKSNGQIPVAHKNTNETVSPVYWFKNPDSSLASSFQSDIEAMQADIASYAVNNRMSKAPVRASPVSHQTAANRSTESHVSVQSGPTQAVQMSESKKAGNVSRVEQQPMAVSSPVRVKINKADALAAIQIKQELVESMSRYKSSSPNSTNVNSSSIKAASQTSSMKTVTPPSVKDVPVLTNKLPSSVKDPVENISSQQHLEFNARRHSLSETNKTKQHPSASPNSFLHTTHKPSKTSEYMVETIPTGYLRHQSMDDQTIQSGQQFIQTRRNTTPSSLDRSLGSIYNTAYSPDERQNMDRYRSPVGALAMGSQNPTSQNSIHHLVEQVQSIPVPYPHIQQQQQYFTASTKNKQGDGVNRVDKTGQEQPKLAEETLCVKQPPFSSTLSNGTPQKMAPAKNAVVKMEQADVSSKSISVICYVMLHDYKLICLKSSSEKLLFLNEFHVTCFPDRNIENVNICIDQILQIKRKLLNHQDTEKVILFLKKNGLHFGNVLQTITLYDAKRVYHYLYGITNCTHASCMAEEFHSEVDHNTQVPSLCASSVGRELKKDKSSDDSNSRQFVPAKPPETNIITQHEHFLNTINHNGTEATSSQIPTSLPHSSKDNVKINQRAAIEKEVDSDDSDDLILVEASEDPHIIRWSGNVPKVGGICNTIIGQLRSYVHEQERFLVVDDLCRVFGTNDFYDGVEKENIILYSCCPEIAQFLNAMHKSFPPLQSHRHSLVKEKDIGIHIIDSDYTPGGNGFEKDKMASQTLKRFLCKQEVVDDDCSSPKQFKLGDSAQVLESKKQSSSMVQPLLLNQYQSEKSVRDLSSSGLRTPGITEQQSSNKMVTKLEAMNRLVHDTENDASDSSKDTSQSVVANKSPSQIVQCKSNLTTVNNSSKEADVQNIQDAQVDQVYSCERTDIDGLSSHSFKETAETTLKTQPVSQISQHVASEQQSKSVTGAKEVTDNAPASIAEMSILQPSQSPSDVSSRQADTAGNILSPVIDEHNSNESLLTIKGCDNKQKHHESPLINETACENISDMQPVPTSVLNSHVSASEVDNHEQGTVDKNNDNSEASVSNQAGDFKFSPLSSFEDLIVSNPTSIILKKRVEKLKYIFETRKNKNLPLPRITLDSRLNLHLLTNDSVCSEDKSSVPGTSVTDLAVERSSSTDSSSDCSNTKDERLQISSDTNCVNSLVKAGSNGQGQNNADINILERPKSPVATNYRKTTDVEITCDQSSVEQQTSVRPQEECSSVDLASQGAVEPPFAKYLPKSHRAVDDSDVMFSRNIDPLDILPSQCWKEYSKLFQEHRALQGLVGELRKNLAHEKAEKEKLEKITKYYEGVINDITSTIKYGGEDTPVVIDDDSIEEIEAPIELSGVL